MLELFNQLLDWVARHPLWAGVLIFLVAMSESLAIVGLIVPGVALMFGIGALIAAGAISFWPTLAWAVAGAVIGDGLSFWLGRRFSDRLSGLWPFSRYPRSLQQGVAFFEKYGGKSVAFGRFFGPVRAVIPLVAGMMGMAPLRFLLANALSALVWAPAYLLPGIVFGASLELASEVAFRLVALLLFLLLVIWLVFHLVHRIFRLLHPHTAAWVQALLRWSQLHPWAGRVGSALTDPNHPEAKGLSILATLLILTTALFALILGAVLEGTALAGVNNTVLTILQSLRTPWADHLMVYITRLGDAHIIFAVALGVFAYLAWRGHRRTLLYWLAAVGFAVLTPTLLKHGLRIPRPDILANPPASYAFPSGHTLKAVVLYGFLAVMIARPIQTQWRWLPYALATLAATGVGLSRLYLGVHWLSDVLGSITLGLAWVSILGIAYHHHTRPETHWRGLTTALAAILSIAMITESRFNHDQQFQRYAPRTDVTEISGSDWWLGDIPPLSTYRQDSRNRQDHPLNLQYAGNPQQLATALAAQGWQPANLLSWDNLLKLLSPSISLSEMPVLPQVHNARHESLVLIKSRAEGARLVLRLWSTDILLTPEQRPLWIGNVTAQQKSVIAGTLSFAETRKEFAEPYAVLKRDIAATGIEQKETAGWLLLRE